MKRTTEAVLREEVARAEDAVTRASSRVEAIEATFVNLRAELGAAKEISATRNAAMDRARAALAAYLGEEPAKEA